MLTPLLIWLAILDLVGWLHFPVCFRIGRHLRDRGLALSKLAGLLVPTYLSWLAAHTATPHNRAAITVIILLTTAVGAALARRDRAAYGRFFRARWRFALALEAVFWIGGIGAGWVRAQAPAIAYDPNWWGAEKWSDFALLSSLSRQQHFPPLDPWLAGCPINYYYFGHLAWATMAKLTATPPNIAYNLAIATIIALALTLCLSLGYHMFRSAGLGLLLAILIVVGGNVKPLAQLRQNSLDAGQFAGWIDFWDSSREMDWGPSGLIRGNEINEFPSFSFILGDLHPHFSAHPVLLGFLLMLAALWRAGQRQTFSAHEVLFGQMPQWLALAGLLGVLYATNTWDCFVGLFLAAAVLPLARGYRSWPHSWKVAFGLLILTLAYIVGVRILFLPFHALLIPPKSAWQGLALVAPPLRSTATQWLFYFGLFVVPFLAWQAWGAAARTPRVSLDKRTAWLSVALALSLLVYMEGQGQGLVGLLVFLLVVLIPSVFRRRRRDRLELAAILTYLALAISFLCEWFYYNDAFSGEDERINTIFKVYYCLWPITALGAVGACSALWGGGNASRGRLRRTAASTLMLALLAISSLYPLFGWTTRIKTYRTSEIGLSAQPTLDGLAYLERRPGLADDYRAALWLRANARPDSVVAEWHSWGYCAAGRFAAIGGVTSLLGWSQHESVWREGIFPFDDIDHSLVSLRKTAIDELFSTTSPLRLEAILQATRADYVAVGSLEREKYPPPGLEKFSAFGMPVVRSGETVIYAVSAAARKQALASGAP